MKKHAQLPHPFAQLLVAGAGRALSTSMAVALIVPTAVSTLAQPAAAAFEDSPKAVLDEAWQLVYREYVDYSFNQTDWVAIRRDLLGQSYASPQAAYSELRRALRRLDDPYTRFLDPDQYAELTEQTAGEISGIGLRLRRDHTVGAIVVIDTLPGSPASRANIRSGDRLRMVDSRAVDRLSVEAVSQLLRGELGKPVTLTLERADTGSQETLMLTRERLEVPTVTYETQEANGIRVGYIRLSEFSAHAAEQMQAAIETLSQQHGVEAFVLDLRNNPGGLLQASIDISRMWLQRGPIVHTVDRDGRDEAISANRTSLTDLPLAVLVNGQSASSSEILTGALQDNDRAIIVGSPTFGKALVQSLHGLSDGSGIAVTVAHYYTPDGTDISRRGITPDVQIDLTEGQQQQLSRNPALVGSSQDPQFLRAVSALEAQVIARRAQQPAPTLAAPRPHETPQLGRTP